jgi:hypothetical protein
MRDRGDTDAWVQPSLKDFKQIQMISNLFKLHSIQTGPSRGGKF